MLSFTFSVPDGGGGVVDHPAVSVHQVGHVLRHSEAGTRDRQQLGTSGHPQLEHGLVPGAAIPNNSL